MQLGRTDLTMLFNGLLERGHERVPVAHPATEMGELFTIELDDWDDSTVRFATDREGYANSRNDVRLEYPSVVADDLPTADQYVRAAVAAGVVPLANLADIEDLVERYSDPALIHGHSPVYVGLDTNLLPWRVDRILGLRDPDEGVGYFNGFVLATGVRDELQWDGKCADTGPFEAAFGPAFGEYWNQPLGMDRLWRLGQVHYRTIRDIDQATEITSDRGDDAIVSAYEEYQGTNRAELILFSNDRNFVELAQTNNMIGVHVAFPRDLPRTASATWKDLETLLYVYTVLFGVLELPGVTLHGVWSGKEGQDWKRERLKLDCRSPKLADLLETDLHIVEGHEELTG